MGCRGDKRCCDCFFGMFCPCPCHLTGRHTKLVAKRLGPKVFHAAPPILFGLLVVGCAQPPSAEEIRRDATCAGIHEFYDQGQSELIERGLCDEAPDVERCPPHKVLVDTKIALLAAAKCPTKKAPE